VGRGGDLLCAGQGSVKFNRVDGVVGRQRLGENDAGPAELPVGN
jgi:hypothetical protein